ncbi:MAG: hypothetical protein Fur0040_05180 [Sideroxydans sp.]
MRFIAALLALVTLDVQAESFEAKVLAVMDGDTLFVQSGPFKAKLRLVNIDAPEKDQPYGKQSQESLQSLVGGKVIQVESKAVDKFGRTIAVIRIGDINVNEEQVRRGMAWAYSRSREAQRYMVLQSEAQAARRGLWQQADAEKPWQWRKRHPSTWEERPLAPSPRATKHPDHPQHRQPGMLVCGRKHACSQMVACDEAHYYLTVCGEKGLDPDRDGVPCESLCVPR